MDSRRTLVEEVVHTLIETSVNAVHAEDFEACVRSLDEAVAVTKEPELRERTEKSFCRVAPVHPRGTERFRGNRPRRG